MNDEQLRAMARRIAVEAFELVIEDGVYRTDFNEVFIGMVDEIEAAAVAILREEMGKHKCVHQLAKEFAESCRHPLETDDPTKSFVATT